MDHDHDIDAKVQKKDEHSHGHSHSHDHATMSKIVAVGTVTLGGAIFAIDRDGQVECGKMTEFGVECVGGTPGVVPTAAWLANPDGTKVADPVQGMGHDTHWHFNVEPLDPVKKSAFVLQVGTEEAVIDYARGSVPRNDGILTVLKMGGVACGYLELKLHGDAGDLECFLYTKTGNLNAFGAPTGPPSPLDMPKETVVTLTFQSHEGKAVTLAVRDMEKNEDEEGVSMMRGNLTNYFIFPGESGQDPEWLVGEKARYIVTLTFEADGKSYGCDPFVLVPHEALAGE